MVVGLGFMRLGFLGYRFVGLRFLGLGFVGVELVGLKFCKFKIFSFSVCRLWNSGLMVLKNMYFQYSFEGDKNPEVLEISTQWV